MPRDRPSEQIKMVVGVHCCKSAERSRWLRALESSTTDLSEVAAHTSCSRRARRCVESRLDVKTMIMPSGRRSRRRASSTSGFCSAVHSTVHSARLGGMPYFLLSACNIWCTSKCFGLTSRNDASFWGSLVSVAETRNLRSWTGWTTDETTLLYESFVLKVSPVSPSTPPRRHEMGRGSSLVMLPFSTSSL